HCARPSRYRHRVIWSTRARVRGAQTGRNIGDPDGTPLALRVTMDAVAFVSVARRWSPVPLRLIVGCGFISHGYAKAVNGPGHFAASLHALGVPAAHAMAWATIGVELLGGLAVLLGAWIPVISLPMAAVLTVAAVTVHLQYGFSSIKL